MLMLLALVMISLSRKVVGGIAKNTATLTKLYSTLNEPKCHIEVDNGDKLGYLHGRPRKKKEK